MCPFSVVNLRINELNPKLQDCIHERLKLTKQQWFQAEGAHVMGPVGNERHSLHMPNLCREDIACTVSLTLDYAHKIG